MSGHTETPGGGGAGDVLAQETASPPSGLYRPDSVPAAARLVDVHELRELHEGRPDKRQYLRVAFPFVIWYPVGWMLVRWTTARSQTVKKPGSSMGRCLIWGEDGAPKFWVWTLADERAEAA